MTPPFCAPFAVAAVYPIAYWIVAATAALRSQTIALVRGPRKQRVVWDIPRERLDTAAATADDTALPQSLTTRSPSTG